MFAFRADQAQFVSTQEAAGDTQPVMFLSCSEGDGGQFLLSGPKPLLDATSLRVTELLQAKGGGRGTTFQGRAASFKRRKEVIDLLRAHLEHSTAATS